MIDRVKRTLLASAPRGKGPDRGRIQMEGNAYLTKQFPNMDFVKKASIAK
jgi:peptidyl-prolyl cis-trans isomerase A (cyclophilin A)